MAIRWREREKYDLEYANVFDNLTYRYETCSRMFRLQTPEIGIGNSPVGVIMRTACPDSLATDLQNAAQ